jgi:methionyl-tRNA synthetase
MITLDDFKKLELRSGKVLEAERVQGTDKLLRLVVDMGEETHVLVAGVGKSYEPGELKGKNIIILVNLEPATIRGIESRGMLLAATGEGPRDISLLTLDRDLPAGSAIS